MRVYRDIYNAQGQFVRTDVVFDIMEVTYNGQDMSKRSITAIIKYATPIGFQIGDYVYMRMQSLQREPGGNRGEVPEDSDLQNIEKFYIYTEPQCKKTARPYSAGDAFETTVTFYPRQFELTGIQMRDFIQRDSNEEKIIYTGFENVTFYGGAHELLRRCKACLDQHYKGANAWNYELAPELDEDQNNALERYTFSFQGNSVMDALMKLNDKDYINTTFYINGRTIYVGKRRPFLCAVNAAGAITNTPLDMMYGKTSHLPIDRTYGGLYEITKSVGEELPITKLFAYGAARNLNRYYCADRIQSGRFVNKLMLPSFSDDGETDYIISEDAVKKYGIREGSKTFEEIYPSLRYMTYADIRGIKYCIKVRTSGLLADTYNDEDRKANKSNSISGYPVARVQCYKVTPCTGQSGDGTVGCNKLVECPPPEDLAVFIHALGKTVKVLLMADDGQPVSQESAALGITSRAVDRQYQHDFGHVPVRTENDLSTCIEGACFCVHDIGFKDMDGQTYDATERANWFTAPFTRATESDPYQGDNAAQRRAELHRIEYIDTFYMTDLYVMEYENGVAKYDDQRSFKRDGYSAWAWPRLNSESNFPDSLPVNEVVGVESVVIPDTSSNIDGGRQQHWDIYLRDLGFAIDEQNDFGDMVFVFSTPVISVLDGILAGREFTIDGGENLNNFQDRVMCAYDEEGNFNQEFLMAGDSGDPSVAQRAFLDGAIWRIRLNRNDNDDELSSIGLVLPNTDIQMKGGDHVVLLDIYMPDIYIRAAENRLLREARNYLDKNDRGNVKYSVNFDKVRFNQIPNYALQMREGLFIRMIDDDLSITSENKIRDIVRHMIPYESAVQLYSISSTTVKKTIDTLFEYGRPGSGLGDIKKVMSYDKSHKRLTIKVKRASKTSEYVSIFVHGHNKTDGTRPDNQTHFAIDDTLWSVTFDCDYSLYNSLSRSNQTDINITEKVFEKVDSKVYPSEGAAIPAISKEYVNFKSGKFYEVMMQVQNAYWHETGTNGSGTSVKNNNLIVLSSSPIDTTTRYEVEDYECEATSAVDGWRTVTYKFFLPDSFNDAQGYYIALTYLATAQQEDYAAIRLVSVVEKDLDAQGNEVRYVDFLVSNVTIKIQDNTRPADRRILGAYPEPIYEIQATIEQQTKASAWGSLMNDVEKTKIEADNNKRTYEMLVNIARQNYQQILNLRNSVFDPDGKCTDLFVQTMMLQVGADSMNYQLEKTLTSATGVKSNYNVSRATGATYDTFEVYDDDVLHHFVYTQGAGNAGTWGVRGDFQAALSPITGQNNSVEWPTYFVCIRCKKDTANDPTKVQWICSTDQYAVNQDKIPSTGATVNEYGENVSDYWYFNWGILTADSNGHYSLVETRGNAYMYGDNLICGKISTLAGNSYFDLTHGNFVLSEGTENDAALSYIDGILTIKGVNDAGVNSILTRLGVVENQEIGGENLLYVTEYNSGVLYITSSTTKVQELTYYSDENNVRTHTYLPAGKYVFSANGVDTDVQDHDYTYSLRLCAWGRNGGYKSIAIPEGDVKDLLLEITEESYIDLRFDIYKPDAAQQSQGYARASKMQLQRGTKSTTFHEYVQHLTDAMHGSTETAGGLLMTNLLMLKNEHGEPNAGMSGISDNNPQGVFGDGTYSEGVSMFAGGSYGDALKQAQGLYTQLQKLLPVLITKTGIHSKIGPFEVISETAVAVKSASGSIIIDTNRGISMQDANGIEKFALMPEDIDLSDITVYRGIFDFESQLNHNSQSATDSNVELYIGKLASAAIPTAGTYKVIANNFAAWVQVYSTTTNNRIQDTIPFSYSIYLKNITSGTTNTTEYLLTSGVVSTNIDGYALLGINSTVTINNLPTGIYGVYIKFSSSYNFSSYMQHYYSFMIRNGGMEILGADGTDYSGKVVIGTNGLLVTAGNSTYMMVKTIKSTNKLDVRMSGIPAAGDGSTIVQGQLYHYNGELRVAL